MQNVPQETHTGTGIAGLTPISLRCGSSRDHFQPRPPAHSVNVRADTVPESNLKRSFKKTVITFVQPCKAIVKINWTRQKVCSNHIHRKNSDSKRLEKEREIPTPQK